MSTRIKGMPCDQSSIGTADLAPMGSYDVSDTGGGAGDRWLVLSDSPESPNFTNPTPLYKCEIDIPDGGTLKVRVFLWHVNGFSNADRRFWIAMGFPSGDEDGTLENHASIRGSADQVNPIACGICLAAAQLFGTLDSDSSGQTVPAGGELAIAGHTAGHADHDRLVGAIHEFEVSAPAGQTLTLRTVVSPDTVLGEPSDDLAPATGHARGSWPYCAVSVAYGTTFDVNVPGDLQYHDVQEFSIGESGSKERVAMAKRTGDTFGTADGNKGLYGVDITYVAHAENSTGYEYNLRPNLRARNNGGSFGGAVSGLQERNSPISGKVSPLAYGTSASSADLGSVKIVPNETDKTLTTLLAVAGGATLEVSLTFQSLRIVVPGP